MILLAPMWVYRSNRLEELARVLGELLAAPGGDPFAPGTVVVLSPGMERWLGMTLAQQLGIAAGLRHPFPAAVIQEAFGAVLGERAQGESWRPDRLAWAVLRALTSLDDPALAPLAAYLQGDDAEPVSRRRLQLARTLAEVLDRALTYRPDSVLRWEEGADDEEAWIAALWRRVASLIDAPHAAALARAFSDALTASDGPIAGFPERLFVFGVTALPPFYLDLLSALSRRVEVHLFVLCPSRVFWGHVQDRRTIARELRRTGAADADALHLEQGHPLLASLGRLARDFQVVLEGGDGYRDAPGDLFVDPGTATTLTALQADILHLRYRGGGAEPLRRDPCDGTVRLHACHGRTRQAEVLHEDLVAIFTELPDLTPRDVLVMTPDIETWAPILDAVFGSAEPRIPFRVVDRTLRGTNPAAEALLSVLALVGGRCEAPAVVDLLSLDAVRARFDISAEELAELVGAVARSGVRWGIDAAHRAEHGQPPSGEHTWRFGLDRLLLGWAMEPDPATLFAGVLPLAAGDRAGAERVGRLAAACEALFGALASLRAPRIMADWSATLHGVLDALICPETAGLRSVQQVRDTLAALAEEAGSPALTFDAARALVEARLGASGGAGGLLSGDVTFAALVPMRSIPFRVVCLLGLDDGAFPRAAPRSSLDVVARAPRIGDRTPRDDDRMMFLEALLAARDRLVITWTGRDPRDDRHLPPCGPVLELIDAIADTFATGDAEATRGRLVRTHPLHPFSPRAYGVGGDEPLSHDRRHLAGARALVGPRVARPPFVTASVAPGDPVVTVDRLARFFRSPLRAWLTERLGVRPLEEAEALSDREPIELDALGAWGLRNQVLGWTLDGLGADAAGAAARASGLLPHGTPGDGLVALSLAEAAPIARVVRALRGGARLDPAEVDLTLGGVRLVGRVPRFPGGLVTHQAGKVKAHHELALWVRHLALHLSVGPADSRLVAVGGADAPTVLRLGALDEGDARTALESLLTLWLRGQSLPLPFAAEASRACAVAMARDPSTPDKALAVARAAWDGEADEAAARILGDASLVDPLPWNGGDFGELAVTVWAPLLATEAE